MFGIESTELAVIALVALLVIGPKDLPRVMRLVGNWLAKGRAMTRHVRAGFDTMMREAELEEMQKAWAAQNDAIMKATAMPDLGLRNPLAQLGIDDGTGEWMAPLPPEGAEAAGDPAASPALPPPPAAETIDVAAAQPRRRAATPAPATDPAPTRPPRKRRARAKLPEAAPARSGS
jgi:sec-independent protein translocase protein TatB